MIGSSKKWCLNAVLATNICIFSKFSALRAIVTVISLEIFVTLGKNEDKCVIFEVCFLGAGPKTVVFLLL